MSIYFMPILFKFSPALLSEYLGHLYQDTGWCWFKKKKKRAVLYILYPFMKHTSESGIFPVYWSILTEIRLHNAKVVKTSQKL